MILKRIMLSLSGTNFGHENTCPGACFESTANMVVPAHSLRTKYLLEKGSLKEKVPGCLLAGKSYLYHSMEFWPKIFITVGLIILRCYQYSLKFEDTVLLFCDRFELIYNSFAMIFRLSYSST